MFPSYLELENTGSQLFRARKTLFQVFEEKQVDPSYLETKKCSSQQL